jgi:hypothetical protein
MLDETKIKNKDNTEMYYILKKVKSDYLYNIHTIKTTLINQGLNPDEIDDILT